MIAFPVYYRHAMRAFLVLSAMIGIAHAEPPSPWIDAGDATPVTPPAGPIVQPESDQRQWRVVAATMLGIRGNQGGLLDGYRISGLVGVIRSPFSLAFALEHQLGNDNLMPGTTSDPARFRESVASARLGWAVPIGTEFWVQLAGGMARVNTRVTRMATGSEGYKPSLGIDAVATFVWRSGYIASTLIFGATAVPSDHEVVVDTKRYPMRARVEPWFGLGVALLF